MRILLYERSVMKLPEIKAGRIKITFPAVFAIIFLSFVCITASAAEPKEVIPGGQSIGVSLSYNGVYIDDFGEVAGSGKHGKSESPAKNAGLNIGEVIIGVGDKEVKTVDEMVSRINETVDDGESIDLKVKSLTGDERTVKVNPVRDTDGKLKIGIWAKDAASGVGTITYYDAKASEFYAVGHEISDSKSGADIGSLCGDVYKCEIVGVRKGERGTPGELIGVYSENKLKIGSVTSSSKYGVAGKVTNSENFTPGGEPIMTMSAENVHEGEAYILSNVENSKIEQYKIEIEKVDLGSDCDKNIIFKVADDNLNEKTGGIVRGMSGSPIIQDGCLVGAVTHVLVNDPQRGYGVFIENME